MSDKTFCMTVYSLEPLPREVRGAFKLPKWPFKFGPTGPIPAPTAEMFERLKIVHYRDELNTFAIMVDPKDGMPVHARQNFRAYKSSAVLLFKGMSISEWSSGSDPVKFRKIVAKHGDAFAWMEWNEEKLILSMDEKVVKYV